MGDHAHCVPGPREERPGPLEPSGAQPDPQCEKDVLGDGRRTVLVLPSSVPGRRRKAEASGGEAERGMEEIRNRGQSPAGRSKYRHPRFSLGNLNRLLNRVSRAFFSFLSLPGFYMPNVSKRGELKAVFFLVLLFFSFFSGRIF